MLPYHPPYSPARIAVVLSCLALTTTTPAPGWWVQ